MGLNELYDEVRNPLPKKLKHKKELYEKYRSRKYDGFIDSPDYQVKKEYLFDIETAIKVQIEKRFRTYTIITTFSALIVILDILLRLFKVIL